MQTLLWAFRNITKEILKVGIAAYDTVADTIAQTTEGAKDLMAEARAKVNAGSTHAASASGSTGSESTGGVPSARELAARVSGMSS